MKLIDKIIAYCKKVEKAERPKQSDKEEYSHGKYAVASSVLKLVELNQPELPTLHPMSELLESQTFNFVAEIERKDNGYKFHECMERNGYLVQGSHRDFTFFKTDNYENEDFKILGWLYVLPKLNEIKPC